MEPRLVMAGGPAPNLVMISATSTNPGSVTLTYDVEGSDLGGPVALEIDRSATASGGSVVKVADGSLTAGDLTVGRHSRTVAISGGLGIDPSHPYVLAVANADQAVAESNATDDTASFRVFALAAVIGGVQSDAGLDSWTDSVARTLRAEGFDNVGAFQWRDRGLSTVAGYARAEGSAMAGFLRSLATRLTDGSPDDVVAVQMIGAGRGAEAASLAMADLASSSTPEALRRGWHGLTLIDPTPATPGSATPGAGPLGKLASRAASWFAAQAQDPTLTIPANVQKADVDFERSGRSSTLVDRLAGTPTSFAIPALGTVQPTYHDVSAQARGLSGLELAYLNKVAPTLGSAHVATLGRVVSATVAARSVPNPANSAALDRQALARAIPSRPLANSLFRQLQRDAALAGRAHPQAAITALQQTFQSIATQTGTIANPVATALLRVLSQDLAALTGNAPPNVPGVQHLHPRGGIDERAVPASSNAHVASLDASATLPASVDLRPAFLDDPNFATPFDQAYEDCSANSLAGAIDYLIATQPSLALLKTQGYEPSRLFDFYNTRFIEGDPFSDSGTYQSDAVAVASTQGLTSEGSATSDSTGATWPYLGTPSYQYQVNPGAANALTGPLYTITSSTALSETASIDSLKSILAKTQVFTFWTNCEYFPDNNQDWPGFKAGVTPTLPAPPNETPTPDDGHFMLCVGYDDAKQAFIVRNSWGSDWGINGFAYMPYSYFTTQIPNSNGAGTWSHAMYTINGFGVTPPPSPSIGDLSQLTDLPNVDTTRGQVHIDTTPAGTSGNAVSFDYYDGSGGKYVTPLLFNYDSSTATYTVTGIGTSVLVNTKKTVGAPFNVVEGSAALNATSVFGFYDGEITQPSTGQYTFNPALGSVPYNTVGDTSEPWLTTDQSPGLTSLTIGESFSLTSSGANIPLSPAASHRTYAAILATSPDATQ